MQKCQLFTIKILALLALFTGCTLFFDTSPIIEKDASLKTNFKNNRWKPIKKSGADFAFEKENSYLYATSVCPAPKDTLEKLSMTLLIQEKNIASQKRQTKDEIDILVSEGKFLVEDQKFHIFLTNYKDDECYYEYVLLNRGEISPETKSDYQAFLDSFKH